jgi:hypothetical protein
MKKNIGIWIDQRKAVVVVGSGESAEIRIIHSHADRQPGRINGLRSTAPYEALKVEADDVSQRKFTQEMSHYFDEILSIISGAQRLLIFGPGEARMHLHKRIASELASTCDIQVEPADKLTDRQIAAHVREHFKKPVPIILSK